MNSEIYDSRVRDHYQRNWGNKPVVHVLEKRILENSNANFRVLEFAPSTTRRMWTYATTCMSEPNHPAPIELHIFSGMQDHRLIELLSAVAFYHQTNANLSLNHTVNFGQSWQNASTCQFGFISLPYLDGPNLETLRTDHKTISFYWLIPITEPEMKYKMQNGTEALEQLFDKGFDYLDSARKSLI